MSGPYSIGGTTPDFTTIQEACDSLKAQGVSGAVVLNIANGVYAENVTLDSVSGVSSTNTITFQSASADSALVSVASTGTAFTVSVPYVNFKNLTIASSGYGIYGDTNNLTVEACHVVTPNNYGVYISNYNTPGNSRVENVTITNSNFESYYCFRISTEKIKNVTVTGCTFDASYECINMDADFSLNNLTVTNCNLRSNLGTAVNLYGGITEINGITFNSVTVHSRYYAVYGYSDFGIKNVALSNMTVIGQAPTYNYNAIYFEGYSDHVDNVSLSRMQIDSVYTGFYVYSEELVNNISVDSVMVTATYRGLYFDGDYNKISNISITNAMINTTTNAGVYMNGGDRDVENVTFDNVSSTSTGREGAYIYGLNVTNVSIMNSFFRGDSTSTGDEGMYINGGKDVKNVNIFKSTFEGGTGFRIYAENDYRDVVFDSVMAKGIHPTSSSSYGINTEANNGVAFNTVIKNSQIMSDTGYAAYIEGNDGQLDYLTIENSTFDGGRYYAAYAYAYSGLKNVYIVNSTFNCEESYGYGLYLYNDYNILDNVLIDSCTFNTHGYGIGIEGYYNQGAKNVTVSNNNFNIDLNGFAGSSGQGIYSYSDGAIDNFKITNNNIDIKGNTNGSAIYVGGYIGGTKNTVIDNNMILTNGSSAEGIYLEYAAENIMIGNNIIDTNGNANYIDYGIYLTGEYNTTDNVTIENNIVKNCYYGLYAEYSVAGLKVKNNDFTNRSNSGGYGMYLWDVKAGDFEITGNIFANADGYLGLEFQNVKLDSTAKGLVANNFVGNFDQGLYVYNCRNILFANNSFTTSDDNTMIEFDYYNSNMEFYNNIVQVDTSNYSSALIAYYQPNQVKGMDYNVFNIDTANSDLVYDGWYGNYYKDLSAWSTFSGFDTASFMEEVVFVNDTFDLHIECTNTSLVAGMPLSQVTTDVDGNVRAAVPTIGADEILTSGNNIFSQTNIDARSYTSYILDAGASSGSVTYLWNTGATTQMITVDSTAWYRVTITDACGSYTDSVYVQVGGYAGVEEATNDLAATLFPNPSNGEFTLLVNGTDVEEYNVRILSISGQLIYQSTIKNGKKQMLDITNQPNGVYFVHLASDKGTSVLRVIKQ